MVSQSGHIRLLVLDIDGVITDGTVVCSAEGPEHKRYSFRDVDALFEVRRQGLVVALVTGESTTWADSIARRLEIDHLVKGAKDKLAAVTALSGQLGIDLAEVCYVGDGPRDAPALRVVGLGLTPADASPEASAAAHHTLAASAGQGAVDEAVRLILAAMDSPSDTPSATSGSATPDVETTILALAEDALAAQRAAVETLAPRIAQAADIIAESLAGGGKLISFGNDGSASDAEHLAAELGRRFVAERLDIAAISLTASPPVATAFGNDHGLDLALSRQLRAFARSGDVAVAISVGGRSPDVVSALHIAREMGLVTIGITGRAGGELPGLVDTVLTVPSISTARIQEAHRLIIHLVCSLVEQRMIADLPVPGGKG